MPNPNNPTPLDPGYPLFNTNGASPDSIFADSTLYDLNYAIDNCSQHLLPPDVGASYTSSAIVAVDQYTIAQPEPTLAYTSVIPPLMPPNDTGGISFPSSPRLSSGHSPTSSSGGSSPPGAICPRESTRRVAKRQMNTLAARRYRKRRLDRINELEAEVEIVKRERDEWRVKASKLEGEASALKSLLESKKVKKET